MTHDKTTTTVQIAGSTITIGPLTACQLAAMLDARESLAPLLEGAGVGAISAAQIQSIGRALASVLGDVFADPSDVLNLPLAEFIDAARETFVAVMAHNTGYLTEQVVPALERLTAVLTAESAPTPEAV